MTEKVQIPVKDESVKAILAPYRYYSYKDGQTIIAGVQFELWELGENEQW